MNLAKKWQLLLGIIFQFLLTGCAGRTDQVFLPEVLSSEGETQEVFVPAVQSDAPEVEIEGEMVSTAGRNILEPVEVTATAGDRPNLANADVIFVQATLEEGDLWTFSVTVAHPDTGWEDYADGWDVLLPDGTVLKPDPESPFTRLLLHPHENEQPFTRSQRGIEIPAESSFVTVRAHDILDGFGGQEIVFDLTAESGPGFEVQR